MALSMHIRDQLQENGRVSQSFEKGPHVKQQQPKHEKKVGWKGKQSKSPYRQQRSRNWHSVGPEEHVSATGGFFL
jgi:hypothetical protein